MPLVIDATPGGQSANSYCTLAEARAFYAINAYATAAGLSVDATLTQQLVWATALLDEHVAWFGYVVTQTQALLWPRVGGLSDIGLGTYGGGVVGLNGYPLPTDSVPQKVKEAVAEFARHLLVSDLTADNDLQTQDVKEIQIVGAVNLKFGTPGTKVVPDAVYSKIRHLGRLRNEGFATAFRV